MAKIAIQTPLTVDKVKKLKAGDYVYISGTIYTARDASHRRMVEAIQKKQPLPFDINNQIIYYAGPCPAKEGYPIGPIGPTTSYRMDKYTPLLLEKGLKGMIGKGQRGDKVKEAIKANTAVYFAAVGGAAAFIAKWVRKSEIIAYGELGAEAVRRLEVVNFPVIVALDCEGKDLYEIQRKKYRTLEVG